MVTNDDFVKVGDVPVVTQQYYFSMLMYQSGAIDRARSRAGVGILLGLTSLTLNVILLVLLYKGLL